MAEGIVTYGERAPVNAELAVQQHADYVAAIADAGWAIREVPHADDLPDSAFVEDTVVVCSDLAVLARPGAAERRAEVIGTEETVRAVGLDVARSRSRARSTVATCSGSARRSTSAAAGEPTPTASVNCAGGLPRAASAWSPSRSTGCCI